MVPKFPSSRIKSTGREVSSFCFTLLPVNSLTPLLRQKHSNNNNDDDDDNNNNNNNNNNAVQTL